LTEIGYTHVATESTAVFGIYPRGEYTREYLR